MRLRPWCMVKEAHLTFRFPRSLSRRRLIRDLEQRVDQLEAERQSRDVSDSLYAAIEDRFRGSADVIAQRQSRYLPHLSEVNANHPVLDLGCGRGEWLGLLSEHGLAAVGVDSNEVFVSQCRAHGFTVRHGDLLAELHATDNESLGAVSMFQVAEHLPLGYLENVLTEAHRVLRTGGILIVEIPNIETLRVGAATFWIDPTHHRPIFPEFLVLLVERAGFTSVERDVSTPLAETPAGLDDVTRQLWERVNGPGDFAVIARK